MDKFDRIQQLHRTLRNRRLPVSVRALAEQLQCTERNVRRLIVTMKTLGISSPQRSFVWISQ